MRRKWIRYFIVFAFVGLSLTTFLLATTPGARLSFNIAQRFLPGEMIVADLHGKLWGNIGWGQLRYRTEGLTIRVDDFSLVWDPSALFHGKVSVTTLSVGAIVVEAEPTSAAPTSDAPFVLPNRLPWDLPLALSIEAFDIKSAQFRQGETDVSLNNFAFASSLDNESLVISELQVVSRNLRLKVTGNAEPKVDDSLVANFKWTLSGLDVGEPDIGELAGNGNIRFANGKLSIEHAWLTPFDMQTSASLFSRDSKPRLEVEHRWRALEYVTNGKRYQSGKGKLSLVGWLDDFELETDADLMLSDIPLQHVALFVSGNANLVRVDNARLRWSAGNMQLQGEYNINSGQLALALDAPKHQLDRWISESPFSVADLALQLNGIVNAESKAADLNLKSTVAVAGHPDLIVSSDIKLSEKKVGLNGSAKGPFELAINSTLQKSDAGEWHGDIAMRWENISWRQNAIALNTFNGKLDVAGPLSGFNYHLTSSQVINQLSSQLNVKGVGSSSNVTWQSLNIDVLQGRVTSSGQLDWQDALSWQLDAAVDRLAYPVAGLQNPIVVSASSRVSGSLVNGEPNLTINVPELSARIKNRELKGQLSALVKNKKQIQAEALVTSGDMRIQSLLKLTDVIEGKIDVKHLQLADWVPDAQGQIDADIALTGNLKQPRANVDFVGSGIAFNDANIGTLNAKGSVLIQEELQTAFELEANAVQLAGRVWESMRFSANTLAKNTQLILEGKGELPFAAKAMVSKQSEKWTIQPESLSFEPIVGMTWTLASAGEAIWEPSRWQLGETCFAQAQGRLCAQANGRAGDAASIQLTMQDLDMQWLQQLAQLDVGFDGRLSGQMSAQQKSSLWQASWDVSTDMMTLMDLSGRGEALKANVKIDVLAGQFANQVLKNSLRLRFGDTGQLQSQQTLEVDFERAWNEWLLRSNTQVNTNDLQVLSVFVPELQASGGDVGIQLNAQGPLGKLIVNGNVDWKNGAIEVLPAGIALSDFAIAARAEAGEVVVDLSARSGPGSITGSGSLKFDKHVRPVLDVTLTGNNFQAFNTPELQLLISPNLRVKYADKLLSATGELLVPKAKIQPTELPEGAVTKSSDIVVRDPEGKTNDESMAISANILFSLGDDVFIDAFGLKTGVRGKVRIIEKPQAGRLANGQVSLVEGKYQAYGQNLDITQGTLNFSGPLDNPLLDFEAQRQACKTNVTLVVNGSVQAPRRSLRSEIPMSESDMMSCLVLGRTMSGNSDSDNSLVANALASLGLSTGESAIKAVGEELGLDDVGIDSRNGVHDASLVVGKYLSPRLYVSYGIGLFDQLNRLKIDLTLSDRLSVSASSGENSGVDFVYSFERR